MSPDTNIYRFALPRETDVLGLPVGQHIEITAHLANNDFVRQYTPISSNQDHGHFELLIKDYPLGLVSQYLNSLNNHQIIKVKGPFGKMLYKPNMAKEIGMIAGGTGISPMLQILGAIIREPTDTTRVSLVYANETEDDILLQDDIDEIAEKYPYFKVHYVLNRPSKGWEEGSTGYVTADIIRKHLPAPSPETKLFICGPPKMCDAMKTASETVGFDKARDSSEPEDQVFIF